MRYLLALPLMETRHKVEQFRVYDNLKKKKKKKRSHSKAQIEIFQSPYCTANGPHHAQLAMEQSCAYHVQHIEHLSRATRRVTCHVVRRDSSTIKFDKVEIAFISALSYRRNH